tara:strand:+ start:1081 stop:1425 length:345 start_codon:yes stop_codon:yes gene_type:complete
MKIYLSILACLLFSCSNTKKKTQNNLLSKTVFENIIKEIHLAEATFELNKNNDVEDAKNKRTNSYFEIYKKNNLSEEDFKATLNYYSEHPEKLEQSYNNILEQLSAEKSKIDQQ